MAFELVAKNGLITNDDLWFENVATEKSFIMENSQSGGNTLTFRHSDVSLIQTTTTSSIFFNLPVTASIITASLIGQATHAIFATQSIQSNFATQSLFATRSLFTTQSLNSTRSIQSNFATQSLFATRSIYATQSLFTTQSLNATRSIQSNFATQSVYSTSSLTASLLTEASTGTGLIVRQTQPTLLNVTASTAQLGIINVSSDVLTINARRISHIAGASSTILGYSGLLNTGKSQHDVAIGYQAGQNAITTSFGVLIGALAGYNATNLDTSILIGIQAGMNLTNSYSSIFIGGNAGVRSGNCAGTVCIGVTSLPDCPSAFYGVAIGGYAGEKVKNADRSVLIGGPAAQNADTVTNSVIIGSYAGNNAKTGSNAIMIGYQSDVLNSLVDANGSIGIGHQTKITKPYQTIIGNSNTTECLLYGVVSASQLTSSNSKFDNVRVNNDLSVINAATVNSLDVAGSLTIDDLGVVNSIGNITAPNFIGTASLAKTASLWTEQNTKLNVADPNSSGSFIHTGSFVVKNATYVNPVSNVILTFTSGAGDYVAGYGNYGVRVYAYKTVGGINVYSTPVEVLQSDTSGTGLSIDDFYGVHIAWTLPSDVDGVKILFYSDNKSYNWNVSITSGGIYYDDSGGGLDLESTVTPTSPLIGAKSIINSPLDITGSVIITGSLIADLIGNASSATTASYAHVAETLAPKTSSWWIPLSATTDAAGAFTALSNGMSSGFWGNNYFNITHQYGSGSAPLNRRQSPLDPDKIIGRNFRITGHYAYSSSYTSWSFTPYLGVSGVHMTGSNNKAGWWALTNAEARLLSGSGFTSWSYSAIAPSTDMWFHVGVGSGFPSTHISTVWLIGIKVENW